MYNYCCRLHVDKNEKKCLYLPKFILNKVLSKRKPPIFRLAFLTFGWNFRPYIFIFPILAFICDNLYVTSRSKEMRKQMISHKQEKEKFECINDIHPCIRIVSFISLYIYKMSTNSGQLSRLPEKNRISWSVERKGDQIETIKNWNT